MKVMKRSRRSEETLTSCMDEMTQTREHLEPCDVCKTMSLTAETEQGLRRLTLRAHSRVHQVCHVTVGFHVLCVDLGFHVVIGVGRLIVQRDVFYTST